MDDSVLDAWMTDFERAAKADDRLRIDACKIAIRNHAAERTKLLRQVLRDALTTMKANGMGEAAEALRKRLG